MKKNKVVVTGGAGFIGSHLVEKLVELGFDVFVVDNLSEGKKDNLKKVFDSISFVQKDILSVDFNELLKDALAVFHLAALKSVPKSFLFADDFFRVNIEGTRRILDAAKLNKCKVIFSSSSSVYGNVSVPQVESKTGIRLSPYAVSKFAGEDLCRLYHDVFGLETVSLRYFNVFGPRQNPSSEYAAVIPKFIKKMLNGESPPIFGDGSQSRDFTFVDNVVFANLQALKTSLDGSAVNIANGSPVSVLQLVDKINEILGTKIKPVFLNERKGDIKHSFADNSLAKKILNYKEIIDFEEGLRRTVDFFRRI